MQPVSLQVFEVRVIFQFTFFFSNLIGKTQLISTNLIAGSIPVAVASCAFLGTAVGVYDHAGKLAGDRASPETWEERRKRFFKPKPTVDVPSDS